MVKIFNGWNFLKASKNNSCWRRDGPFDHHIAELHHMVTSDNSIPYYYALYTPINCPPLMGNLTSKWLVIILDFVHYNTLQRIIMLTPDFRRFPTSYPGFTWRAPLHNKFPKIKFSQTNQTFEPQKRSRQATPGLFVNVSSLLTVA